MTAQRTPRCDPADVRLLAMDCDGVLTDGAVWFTEHGDELKRFSTRDGLGVRLWTDAGLPAAIVTGRGGAPVRRRARELGIAHVLEGVRDKAHAAAALAEATGVEPRHTAYAADDWPDLPLMRLVGYPVAVADAEPAVIEAAAWVTNRPGGNGAVRDLVEHLLAARGQTPDPGRQRPVGRDPSAFGSTG